MRIRKNKKNAFSQPLAKVARLACGLMAAAPLITIAAPWEYGATVDLGVIRTDNVFLAGSGLEESETVYTIAPEFFLTTDGDRLEADVRYRPEAYFYSDFSDADDVFHVLDASMTGTVVRDRLFVYLSAVNFQSIITPDGLFPTTNLPVLANRIDANTLEARPYWQQRLGRADLLLEVGYRDVEYDGEQFQSNTERSGRFILGNIERQQGLAWGLDYQYRQLEYELSMPWEFQRAALDLGFWINGNMRVFAVGGAETSFDNLFESNLDADFWEAGFQYRPSQRLNLEVAAGDRSYGSSLRGNFSYALRRGDVSLVYDEGPATRGELVFDRRPILSTDNLDNILDQPGLGDRFVRRRGEFLAEIRLSRSALTLRIFSEKRESRTTADGMPLADEEYSGAAIGWSWNFGTKMTLGVGVNISERDQTDRKDRLSSGQVDLAYSFSQRMSVRLAVLHAEQRGKETSTFDYTENQVRLLLRTEFR